MIDYNRLIHSVTYYLSYQDRIGRDFMINESSLKYPVADYLTSLELPISEIKLEFPHPDLERRRIDLVMTDKGQSVIERAFEFKLSVPETKYDSERRRIFHDLMRLYLVQKSSGSACFFIIAGRQNDFIQCFRSIVAKRPTSNSKDLPEPEGFYTEWFGFKPGERKTFSVSGTQNLDYQNIYASFLRDYTAKVEASPLELPASLTTTCVCISALSREFPTPYVGGIWKVE